MMDSLKELSADGNIERKEESSSAKEETDDTKRRPFAQFVRNSIYTEHFIVLGV